MLSRIPCVLLDLPQNNVKKSYDEPYIKSVLNDTTQFNKEIFPLIDSLVESRDVMGSICVLRHLKKHDRFYEYELNEVFNFLSKEHSFLVQKFLMKFKSFNHLGEYFLLKYNPELQSLSFVKTLVETASIDCLYSMCLLQNKAINSLVFKKISRLKPEKDYGLCFRIIDGYQFISLSEFALKKCMNFCLFERFSEHCFFVANNYSLNQQLETLAGRLKLGLKKSAFIFKQDHTFYVQIEASEKQIQAYFLSSCGHYQDYRFNKMEAVLIKYIPEMRCHRFKESTQRLKLGGAVHAIAFFRLCHSVELSKCFDEQQLSGGVLEFPDFLISMSEIKGLDLVETIHVDGKPYPLAMQRFHMKLKEVVIKN
jgi:hypothetical protein